MGSHRVRVSSLPEWVDHSRLLGEGQWTDLAPCDGRRVLQAELPRDAAADLGARLRGVVLAGRCLQVEVVPPLDRRHVRSARTDDARRRRDTSVGFGRPGVRLDEEGRRSLTPEALALALGERAGGCRVLDACAGVGGNAIGFARAGCAVVAVELDPARLKCAQHNARLYGVDERIEFVQGDCRELLSELQADLLFVDPPWGAEHNRKGLGIDGLPPLRELLTQAGAFPRTWLKLPAAFRSEELPEARFEAIFGEAAGDQRRIKFLLGCLA